MTPAQADLLRRCIEADRLYRSAQHAGTPIPNDERGIEIGYINGVAPRTARALAELGLIDLVNTTGRHCYAFLGKYEPYDSLEGN